MQHEQVFGRRFLLRQLLGKGAYGSVYQAWDQQAQREVALKIVSLKGRADAQRTAARFEREGQLTAALSHPGIVGVHSQGQEGDQLWLAYELVQGARQLNEVFAERELRGRIELIAAAADALGYAHEREVTHRDVKPENILVDANGRVRVADFGIAAAQGLDRLTQTGAVIGTPLYMSPEQFAMGNLGPVGAPADVWSLGVILYEALTDRPPFQAPGLWELGAQVMGESPERPRKVRADAPAPLEAVCLKALSRDPAVRYPTADLLAEDLRRWLAGASVSAVGPRPWELLPRGARWALLAAVPALILAAVFLRHAPEVADDAPVASVSSKTTATPALPRWRPKVGELRWVTLGWEQQEEGARFSMDGLVELRLEERVTAVADGQATVEAKIEALRLQVGDAIRYDSHDPTASLIQLGGVIGSTFTYVVQLDPIRLVSLEGGNALGKSTRNSLAAAEQLSGNFLNDLSDAQLGRHVAALYALNPPRNSGTSWEEVVEVCPREGLVIRQRCAFEREESSFTARLLEASVTNPPMVEVPPSSVSMTVEGRVDRGRLDSLWLTTRYTLLKKGRAARHRWRLYVSPETEPAGEMPQLDAGVSQFVKPESRAEAYLNAGYTALNNGDRGLAFKYYLLAARGGSTQGMLTLGTAYERGTGTRENPRKALEWFSRAAEAGEPEGYTRMGRIHFYGGQGLPPNPARAVGLFQAGINAGNSRGWEYLGLAYRDGRGRPRDYKEARRCFRRAAAKDNPDAMQFLAELLAEGKGGSLNLAEAERLLEAALKIRPDDGQGIRYRQSLERVRRLRAEQGS